MRKSKRNAGLLSLAWVATLALTAAPARADCRGMREFRGRIVKLERGGKQAGFTIKNRRDDKVSFRKPSSVEFVDHRDRANPVGRWKDLETGMDVSVCWKFTDNPSLAHKVIVRCPPSDGSLSD